MRKIPYVVVPRGALLKSSIDLRLIELNAI